MSAVNSFTLMFAAPSSASARNGSSSARFSNACISAGESSPRRYFSISCFSSCISFHTDLQVSLTILDVAFYFVEIKSGRISYLLITFFLQVKQFYALLLFKPQFLHALFQFTKICFVPRLIFQMQKGIGFHKYR